MSDDQLREDYPGQHTTPTNGCPVCGGPIDVDIVEYAVEGWVESKPGRWSCPRGCDPRTLMPLLSDDGVTMVPVTTEFLDKVQQLASDTRPFRIATD